MKGTKNTTFFHVYGTTDDGEDVNALVIASSSKEARRLFLANGLGDKVERAYPQVQILFLAAGEEPGDYTASLTAPEIAELLSYGYYVYDQGT